VSSKVSFTQLALLATHVEINFTRGHVKLLGTSFSHRHLALATSNCTQAQANEGSICSSGPQELQPIALMSAIIHMQVKAKVREVQLHRDSPLGDTLLECYSCGSRNTFGLGFVPVKSENSVVLLCRDHPATASGIKELNLDLNLWQPLIEDRAFMPWLVKQPTQQVLPTNNIHILV